MGFNTTKIMINVEEYVWQDNLWNALSTTAYDNLRQDTTSLLHYLLKQEDNSSRR